MKTYEYKFVKVPTSSSLKARPDDAFEACKEIISKTAREGWRLVQIVTPFHEKAGVFAPTCYQVIFEREAE